ncbi:hypothetical protein PLICRDRAFT_98192 [Plicaturopsis crispa FD-325 SS-3]|nr:hypothetical protein PLICRDRAFT_98192 [Plicaturopsis crispa FD-325 SS-3]
MGVHQLTRYLRENKRALSKPHELSSEHGLVTPIVVDGWSFIYDVYNNSNLSWVYGGEYADFTTLVETTAHAWLASGAELYFVFDGPHPQLKTQTLIARLGQSNVQPSQLFFRTSAFSRSTPQFLHENRIIPPLCYAACLHALQAVASSVNNLKIFFADEEGDPYAIELAGRVRGYLVGLDSDLVVMNADGYRGYVPHDEMVWSAPQDPVATPEQDDDEFQPVRKAKGKKKTAVVDSKQSVGFVPPDVSDLKSLTLSFASYEPSTLASHLNLPDTLLPLLAALLGNDYSTSSKNSAQLLFFERSLTIAQRINRVVTTLRTIRSAAPSPKRVVKHPAGSAMDLIDQTVNALLLRPAATMGSGEIDAIVEHVVEAALKYAIPKCETDGLNETSLPSASVCALHDSDVCPIMPLFSRSLVAAEDLGDEVVIAQKQKLRSRFISAYRSGALAPKVVDILNTGTYFPRLFLEDPDLENVGRSIGRPLREWLYALLHDAVGLPERPVSDDDAEESVLEEDDDDELIDVVEESDSDDDSSAAEDPLAPLRGQLERLHSPDATRASTTSSARTKSLPLPVVVEYVRRGTRIAPEECIVTSSSEMFANSSSSLSSSPTSPLQLRPDEERFAALLHILHSDVPSIRAVPQERLMTCLALRWIIWTLHTRARVSGGNKEREKERWTQTEARYLLAAFSWPTENAPSTNPDQDAPPVLDRNVQLVAQVAMALESIEHLSQVLLVSHMLPTPIHRFSGRRFHSLLTGVVTLGANDTPDELWSACTEGLEDAYAVERKKKSKKDRTPEGPSSAAAKGRPVSKKNGGLFGLLADADA